MGTVMAGRRVGYIQAAVMVAGFLLVMTWMGVEFIALFRLLSDMAGDEAQLRALRRSWNWTGWWGAILCAVAWGWSLVSSIEIVRQARQTPPVLPRI